MVERQLMRRERRAAILAAEPVAQEDTLNRVKAGRRADGTYSLSAMTLGSRISNEGERTTWV